MSSMDLVEFLNARLDEDEQVARVATHGRWRIDPRNPNVILEEVPIDSVGVAGQRRDLPPVFTGQISSRGRQADRDAVHIARWQPARVLADVAAKRSLIEQYQDAEKDAFDHRNDLDRGEWRAFWYSLRLFALPYADHPDYRQEWQP